MCLIFEEYNTFLRRITRFDNAATDNAHTMNTLNEAVVSASFPAPYIAVFPSASVGRLKPGRAANVLFIGTILDFCGNRKEKRRGETSGQEIFEMCRRLLGHPYKKI